MIKGSIFLVVLLLVSSNNSRKREELVFTIVSAIVDTSSAQFTQQMETLKLMMTTTNFNFFVLIQPDKLQLVPAEVRTKRIIFIDANTTALGEVWL